MDSVAELKHREHDLRDRIRQAPASEFGASPAGHEWIVNELLTMRQLLDLHLAEVPLHKRQIEAYRMEIQLPIFQYLSRAYSVFYPEAMKAVR